jgi:hypothetical protein
MPICAGNGKNTLLSKVLVIYKKLLEVDNGGEEGDYLCYSYLTLVSSGEGVSFA